MILRKSDLTKAALELGIWDSLCEKAGIDPDSPTAYDADVDILSCANATVPYPPVSKLDSKNPPISRDIINNTKRLLNEQINSSPDLVRSYIHELDTAGSPNEIIQELMGLRESVRLLEAYIQMEATKKEITSA